MSTEAFSFFSAGIRVPFKFLRGLFLLACLLLVRVPLLGQIVIGFLDVLLAGILWNAQDPKNASQKDQNDIKKAYHNLAKLWYPDKKEEGKKEEAIENFKSNSDTRLDDC